MTIHNCGTCGLWHENFLDSCSLSSHDDRVPWTDELQRRCSLAGYGKVLIGRCDVLALDADDRSFCLKEGHPPGPQINGWPAIWAILEHIGVPRVSASCHWVGLNIRKMTAAQRALVVDNPCWIVESVHRRAASA